MRSRHEANKLWSPLSEQGPQPVEESDRALLSKKTRSKEKTLGIVSDFR